jgi:hypothetical protein
MVASVITRAGVPVVASIITKATSNIDFGQQVETYPTAACP